MSPVLSTFSGASARAFGFGYSLAASAFEHIETQTVGAGGASSITFSSIPGTYKHLQLRYISRRSTTGITAMELTFNGVTSAGSYKSHYLLGNGTAASAGDAGGNTFIFVWYSAGSDAGTNVFSSGVLDVVDYASSTKNKTVRYLNGLDMNGSGYLMFASGLFINTSAVTSMTLNASSGNWAQYTSFSLYGVK